MAVRQALISVWNKRAGRVRPGLAGENWEIWASGGTADAISRAGVPVKETEGITGISSILGGRVKTLHPELHAAILAAGEDREDRIKAGKPVFDLVAVDFYPFHMAEDMDLKGMRPSSSWT